MKAENATTYILRDPETGRERVIESLGLRDLIDVLDAMKAHADEAKKISGTGNPCAIVST